jgi:hypothetical protein
MRMTHRVALELDVEDDSGQLEPEEWDLQCLIAALTAGLARPLRTIRGLVVDVEHDRMSATLDALAADIDEITELHWMASASPSLPVAPALRRKRPSLELLIELEAMAEHVRRLASRLEGEGL